jgi:hypothetical protein
MTLQRAYNDHHSPQAPSRATLRGVRAARHRPLPLFRTCSTTARMCKRCEFPVQITTVIALLPLAHPALAVQAYAGSGRLRFFHPKPEIFRFPKNARPALPRLQLKEVININYGYCGTEPSTNATFLILGVAEVGKAVKILEQAASAATAT